MVLRAIIHSLTGSPEEGIVTFPKAFPEANTNSTSQWNKTLHRELSQ